MVNTKLLKSYFVKNGLTQSEVAAKVGISYQSLSDKINNKTQFKVGEVFALCDILKIKSEMTDIFFAKNQTENLIYKTKEISL